MKASPDKRGRGRPRTYLHFNGAIPQAPLGGWQSASANTPHGRLLIEKLLSGEIPRDSVDYSEVYNNYSICHVVDPAVFPKFFRRCVLEAYNLNLNTMPSKSNKMPSKSNTILASTDPSDKDSWTNETSFTVPVSYLALFPHFNATINCELFSLIHHLIMR